MASVYLTQGAARPDLSLNELGPSRAPLFGGIANALPCIRRARPAPMCGHERRENFTGVDVPIAYRNRSSIPTSPTTCARIRSSRGRHHGRATGGARGLPNTRQDQGGPRARLSRRIDISTQHARSRAAVPLDSAARIPRCLPWFHNREYVHMTRGADHQPLNQYHHLPPSTCATPSREACRGGPYPAPRATPEPRFRGTPISTAATGPTHLVSPSGRPALLATSRRRADMASSTSRARRRSPWPYPPNNGMCLP